MDFYTITIIVFLVLLIICLTLFGVYYKDFSTLPFPEIQDMCPTFWKYKNGNCINDTSLNKVVPIPNDTPGRVTNGFNPNDVGWLSYGGAKNHICGKQIWTNKNNILWNGVSNYNSC